MSTEQMRSEFEKWWDEHFFGKDNDFHSMAWVAWQSSRAALVVELPAPVVKLTWHYAGSPPDDFYEDVDIARRDGDKSVDGADPFPVYAGWQIHETLYAAGIKAKESR